MRVRNRKKFLYKIMHADISVKATLRKYKLLQQLGRTVRNVIHFDNNVHFVN